MIQQFTTTDTEDNLRLGVFLAEKLDISRSQAQKLVKGGLVKVNGKEIKKPSLKVMDSDVVDVEEELQVPSSKLQAPDLDVLYENADMLVVNKPSDLLVHRTMPEDTSPTLVDALLKHDPGIAGVGDDPEERPGIVHRLDKNASGVLVVAKSQEAFEHLKQQFATRAAKKEYTALVYGKVEQDDGEINFRIGRSKRSGKMVAKPEGTEEGREAITTFDVVKRYATTTLLKVQIKTGRTHQIRAHMLAYDHPVVGDPLYKKRVMNKIRPIELDRLFLHAAKLTITLPSGETKTFEAPLPEDLETLLTKLS
jgi:23S rRNA pseudouridine1911/1915/1917 synthase